MAQKILKKSKKKSIRKKIKTQTNPEHEFDVALSFAGEDRAYVDKVANYLMEMGYKPFYDQNETVTLWGKDLYEHLSNVYSKQARYTVVFISKYYAKKNWTNHERKSAQARAFSENQEYLLPARFDKTEIPGIHPTTGYIDLSKIKPAAFANLIKEKLGPIRRKNFFPREIDRLLDVMEIKKKSEIMRVTKASYMLFRSFALLTEEERFILMTAATHGCPEGPPDNVHIEMPYLERILQKSESEIIEALGRIESLGFEFELEKPKKKKNKFSDIGHAATILKIRFYDQTNYNNSSDVFDGVFKCFIKDLCPHCVVDNTVDNNFSILSSVSGFPDRAE